ncbi:MAG: PilZ domain-containing protein [Sulfuricaulis sp.]
MKAEQRTSIRKKMPLNILINYDLAYSKRWKIHDLSLGGVLVEMDQDKLVPGVPIEAVLALKKHPDYGVYRLPAEVVRLEKNRVALRFRNYDDQAYTALVNLLYGA